MSADLFHSDNPIYHRRLLKHRVGILLSISAMAVGIFALLWILAVLIINGLSAIDIDMFTHTTPAPGSEGGGLLNPIVGSLLMVGIATLISTPIGIFAGIYLAEYGQESKFAQVTRFGGNISRTATFVGMERSALHRKLKSLGVGAGERPTVLDS